MKVFFFFLQILFYSIQFDNCNYIFIPCFCKICAETSSYAQFVILHVQLCIHMQN